MINILNSYLAQQRSISIPGLGSLYADTVPVVSDFVNHRLLPPQYKYRFDKYFDAPDKEFFLYLASKKNIADFEAIKWYNEFAYDLRANIRNNGSCEWPGIGVFSMESNGEIIFKPFVSDHALLPNVNAERVIRHDASHAIRVGDREVSNHEMNELLHGGRRKKRRYLWLAFAIPGLLIAGAAAYVFYINNWDPNKVVSYLNNLVK